MFFVCDLELRSVNKGIVGSEKRETKGEEQGKADGCSKTCFYTTRRNLFSPIRTANCNIKGKIESLLDRRRDPPRVEEVPWCHRFASPKGD
jgi:hypothetical protein